MDEMTIRASSSSFLLSTLTLASTSHTISTSSLTSADELSRPDVNSEAVDFRVASEFLSGRGRSAGFGLARLALRPSPTGHLPAFLRLTLGAASAILTACLERATPFGKDSRP